MIIAASRLSIGRGEAAAPHLDWSCRLRHSRIAREHWAFEKHSPSWQHPYLSPRPNGKAGSGDYHLRANSPAKGTGLNFYPVFAADADGRPPPPDRSLGFGCIRSRRESGPAAVDGRSLQVLARATQLVNQEWAHTAPPPALRKASGFSVRYRLISSYLRRRKGHAFQAAQRRL